MKQQQVAVFAFRKDKFGENPTRDKSFAKNKQDLRSSVFSFVGKINLETNKLIQSNTIHGPVYTPSASDWRWSVTEYDRTKAPPCDTKLEYSLCACEQVQRVQVSQLT